MAAANVDPYQHYVTFGWREGRNPNAFFDTSYYLIENLDVAAAGINPLDHYEQFGWMESRDPSSSFSTSNYLTANPDVAVAGMNPLEHYYLYGQYEGRNLTPMQEVNSNSLYAYAPSASFQGYDGSGQAIVIIDDGHSTLYGNDISLIAEYDFGDVDTDATSDGMINHGAMVGNIAWQTASGADFIYLKVIADGKDYASYAAIEAALNWVINNKVLYNIAAVNMSLGGGYASTTTYTAISDEFRALNNMGVINALAAGNDNINGFFEDVSLLAADPNVVGVSASNTAGYLTHWSQQHPDFTDLVALGSNVPVIDINGDTQFVNGTSFSTPQVAGAVAVAQEASENIRGYRLTTDEFITVAQATGEQVLGGQSYKILDVQSLMNELIETYLPFSLASSESLSGIKQGPRFTIQEFQNFDALPSTSNVKAVQTHVGHSSAGEVLMIHQATNDDDILFGSHGQFDIFTGFSSASGHDVIHNFDVGVDQLHNDFWFAQGIGNRVNLTTNEYGDTVIDLYTADQTYDASITLKGITETDWNFLHLTA